MTFIVKNMTRIITPFAFLFGIYIVLYGHISPGGGFAGGVIMASALILFFLSFGKEETFKFFNLKHAAFWDSVAALGFLGIGVAGWVVGDSFFHNYFSGPGNFNFMSAGIIPWCNIAIGIKVGACLFGGIAALSIFRGKGK